jgi:PiT family inorganic phosphate transporter
VVDVTSQVILCALLGGIIWNLITWWFGLPSSSSHALIGGLCGAALAAAHNSLDGADLVASAVGNWTKNKGLLWKVVVPMITSPIAGFLLGVLVMGALWALIAAMAKAGRLARPAGAAALGQRVLRQGADPVSAAYMGFAHGHNDAQKTMGIIALTLFGAEASGALDNLPGWLAVPAPGRSGGEKASP